jgi:hypothetical protein
VYVRENFESGDRLAVVAVNRRSGAVVQRLARSESIAREDCQRWLHYMNHNGYDIFVSMNPVKEDARGRTKNDIAAVRHVYLDLDHGGEEALDMLRARTDLPKPNYVLTTSPGKYQIVWKVEEFTPEQAETLQRNLAREAGADPAATDSSRVLRLPGFSNRKYAKPLSSRVASFRIRSTVRAISRAIPKVIAERTGSTLVRQDLGKHIVSLATSASPSGTGPMQDGLSHGAIAMRQLYRRLRPTGRTSHGRAITPSTPSKRQLDHSKRITTRAAWIPSRSSVSRVNTKEKRAPCTCSRRVTLDKTQPLRQNDTSASES